MQRIRPPEAAPVRRREVVDSEERQAAEAPQSLLRSDLLSQDAYQ